ncbi:hypothetical protein [Viridibacillus soli]|uniref:hypothetical protein n=1 Tax=Viridibacillus soli TaxID=2798301 RepID=UPI001F3273C6|nr:hypothetical protein [Viridibacillus soli]
MYYLSQNNAGMQELSTFCKQNAIKMLSFANRCGALTTTKKGAIHALPTITDIDQLSKID